MAQDHRRVGARQAASGLSPESGFAMTLPLRVALIGTGAIARSQHLPAWSKLPEFKVVALADPSPVSLAAVPSEFDIQRRVADYRELIDDREIDVVDICVP